ncbi:MAG: hemerythrin family protein [Magnetococcales bacterium]|nr:hemerythrin family protein [Magnetococcales bacterium]
MTILYEWKPEYSTGVDAIDEDHKMIFSLINQFKHSVENGEHEFASSELLDKLIDYVNFHFAREENKMSERGLASLTDHQYLHEDLKFQVIAFRSMEEQEKAAIIGEIGSFLEDWLINHIIKVDVPTFRP